MGNPAPIVFFRVDAHYNFGIGHVYRCLNLALGLREDMGIESHFLVLAHTLKSGVKQFLSDRNFQFSVVSGGNEYIEDITLTKDFIRKQGRCVMVVDLLSPDSTDRDLLDDENLVFTHVPRYLESLHELNVPLLAITDEMERIDIRPDVVVDPACHFPAMNFDDIPGTRFYLGPDYYFLGSDFVRLLDRSKQITRKAHNVLVVFGGSDLDGFIVKTVRALEDVDSIQLKVVLGPAVLQNDVIINTLERTRAIVLHAPPSIAQLIFDADIAITHGGNTVYELAAMRTPTVVLCRRERQLMNADFFHGKGTLTNLGNGSQVSESEIRDAVTGLAEDYEHRLEMSHSGRRAMDGKGVKRTCEIIGGLLEQSGWRY